MKPKAVKTPIVYIWIYLAVLTCIVGYGFYCNLDFNPNNAAGVIVAILGILITVVVCWQIYNAYEMSLHVNEMKKLKGSISRKVDKTTKKSDNIKRLAEANAALYETIYSFKLKILERFSKVDKLDVGADNISLIESKTKPEDEAKKLLYFYLSFADHFKQLAGIPQGQNKAHECLAWMDCVLSEIKRLELAPDQKFIAAFDDYCDERYTQMVDNCPALFHVEEEWLCKIRERRKSLFGEPKKNPVFFLDKFWFPKYKTFIMEFDVKSHSDDIKNVCASSTQQPPKPKDPRPVREERGLPPGGVGPKSPK